MEHDVQPRPHRPTGASLIALVAIAVTVVGIAVLHVVRNDLDWREAVMSTYANGPAGDLMSVVFYAFGAIVLTLAVRLRTAVVRHGITSVFPWLMVLAGSGSILAGMFEVDPGVLPSTTAEVIHSTSAIAAFVLLVVSMGLFTLATRGDRRWDRFRLPSAGLSVLAASAAVTTQLVDHTRWTGAAQRVLAGAVLAWFLLVALYVRTKRFAVRGANQRCGPSLAGASVGAGSSSWWRTRWARGGLSLAIVALIFGFFFPKIADYGAVWDTVTDMTPLETSTLAAVAIWNLVSYWPMLTAVQPSLRLREAAVANLASTAVSNTMPGGGALAVGVTMSMQRSWGHPVAQTTLAMVVAGVWNNFVKLGLPVVALGLLALNGEAGAGLAVAAVIGLAVLILVIGLFALLLRSDRLAAIVGRSTGIAASAVLQTLHRPAVTGWDAAAVAFRGEVVALLSRRWLRITVTSLVSHLSLFLVLLLALRHVGVANEEVSWQLVLAAFSFVRLVSAIPITPGGLGLVELGLTATLAAGLPESTRNQIVAAVLVYRGVTWLLPIPLGVGCWAFWRINTRWRHDVARPPRLEPSLQAG